MSRQELVGAFLEGRISRRTLIRRLIAGGVSTGAAISYAQMLSPQQAAAAPAAAANDHYPMVDMRIASDSLTKVRNTGRLVVEVTTTEELRGTFFRVFLKKATGGIPIGSGHYPNFITAAGTRQAAIDIDVGALGARTGARFYVHLQGADSERYPALATAGKNLR